MPSIMHEDKAAAGCCREVSRVKNVTSAAAFFLGEANKLRNDINSYPQMLAVTVHTTHFTKRRIYKKFLGEHKEQELRRRADRRSHRINISGYHRRRFPKNARPLAVKFLQGSLREP